MLVHVRTVAPILACSRLNIVLEEAKTVAPTKNYGNGKNIVPTGVAICGWGASSSL